MKGKLKSLVTRVTITINREVVGRTVIHIILSSRVHRLIDRLQDTRL